MVSLDAGTAESYSGEEAASGLNPEKQCERRETCVLLERVMQRLEDDLAQKGGDRLFETLKPMLAGDRGSATYAVLAGELGVSEAALKMKVHRMRRHYRQLLRNELAQTVATAAEVEEEIRDLFRALSG